MLDWDLKRLNDAKLELKTMQDALPYTKKHMPTSVYPGLVKNIKKKIELIKLLEKHVK